MLRRLWRLIRDPDLLQPSPHPPSPPLLYPRMVVWRVPINCIQIKVWKKNYDDSDIIHISLQILQAMHHYYHMSIPPPFPKQIIIIKVLKVPKDLIRLLSNPVVSNLSLVNIEPQIWFFTSKLCTLLWRI